MQLFIFALFESGASPNGSVTVPDEDRQNESLQHRFEAKHSPNCGETLININVYTQDVSTYHCIHATEKWLNASYLSV